MHQYKTLFRNRKNGYNYNILLIVKKKNQNQKSITI